MSAHSGPCSAPDHWGAPQTHAGLRSLSSCWQRRTFRKSSTSWGSSSLWHRTPWGGDGGVWAPLRSRCHHQPPVSHLDVELQALPALLQHFGHPVGDTPWGEVGHLAALLDLGHSEGCGRLDHHYGSPGKVPGCRPLVPTGPRSSPACAAPGTRCSASPPCAAGHCTAPPPGTPAPPHPHPHSLEAGAPDCPMGHVGPPRAGQDTGGCRDQQPFPPSSPGPFIRGMWDHHDHHTGQKGITVPRNRWGPSGTGRDLHHHPRASRETPTPHAPHRVCLLRAACCHLWLRRRDGDYDHRPPPLPAPEGHPVPPRLLGAGRALVLCSPKVAQG